MHITTQIHTALPNSPTPQNRTRRLQVLPLSVASSQRSRQRALIHNSHSPRDYHLGSSPFTRRYSENPRLFLLLPLMICLSPGGPPSQRDPFRHQTIRPPLVLPHVLPRYRCLCLPCGLSTSVLPVICFPHPDTTIPYTTLQLLPHISRPTDPAAGSPTAAMLRLISYLVQATHASRHSSHIPS